MEPTREETREESTRRGARSVGRLGSQRSQEAGQQSKRPEGRSGQKSQEDHCSQAQRSAAKTRTPQEKVRVAMASIRARFGKYAIGFGGLGIRYARVTVDPLSLRP
jgi:hypothetical protein